WWGWGGVCCGARGGGVWAGGLRREWAEEVVADFEPEFRLVGLLHAATTPVGRVHLGAVYVADAAGRPVVIRETEKLTGGFASPGDVAAVAGEMETWSRLVFDFLEAASPAGPRHGECDNRSRRSHTRGPSHRSHRLGSGARPWRDGPGDVRPRGGREA